MCHPMCLQHVTPPILQAAWELHRVSQRLLKAGTIDEAIDESEGARFQRFVVTAAAEAAVPAEHRVYCE